MTKKTLHIIVSGHVQGVGFRYFTYRQALKLQLNGYVKNLESGSVEIAIQGSDVALTKMINWLEMGGPASASIENFTQNELLDTPMFMQFQIAY